MKLKYLARPFLAAVLVALIDSIGLFLFEGIIVPSTLALLLFLEGGGGLLAGVGISLSSSPSVSKAGETILGTDPWSKDAQKHAEGVGWRWMTASVFIVLIGFVVSVA